MTSVLAAIRPDEVNLPLLVHVLGAMILVGGLLTGASALALARGSAEQLRLGYYSLLLAALPGFFLMRAGAHWVYTEAGWDDVEEEPAWLGIGWLTADLGGALFLVSLVVGGVGVYRLRSGKGHRMLQATLAISLVLLVAYLVAAWAMAAKPD